MLSPQFLMATARATKRLPTLLEARSLQFTPTPAGSVLQNLPGSSRHLILY